LCHQIVSPSSRDFFPCADYYLQVKYIHRNKTPEGEHEMNTNRRRYSEAAIAKRHPELHARLLKSSCDAIARNLGLME
jgi:hypothetical protein